MNISRLICAMIVVWVMDCTLFVLCVLLNCMFSDCESSVVMILYLMNQQFIL